MRRLQAGEKIGDYTIRGFLGAGGMGEVYQGVHTRINRLAAIKVLSRYANNPTFTTRFLNEARVQSSLHHPNIATLYDFKEINNQLYIFMEFADGDTLEDLNKSRFFAVDEALKTFEAVCEAVAFIHRNGIIHRDIKAQNVKLTSSGTVKLLDFGIAKDAASQRLTKVGGMIGTPHYLAPELLGGQEATVQSDVWALGVLFYGMLTGVEPFKAETFGELHSRIVAAAFEPPENANPAISREVSAIVGKCLEKQPENRYRTADEILIDVRSALRGEKQRPAFFGAKKRPAFRQSGGAVSLAQQTNAKKAGTMAFVALVSAIAVLMVFGVIGIGIWAMSDGGNVNVAVNNSSIAVVRNSTPLKNPNSQNATVAALKGSPVRVLVETTEGSAEVFRGGQSIGKTPFEIEGSEGEIIDLTLKRPGFAEKQAKFEVTARRRVYTFAMSRQ